MEKILVYPFNYEFLSFINQSDKLYDCEINSLVSPKGWLEDKNQYKLNNKLIEVSDSFYEEVNKNSLVWFVETLHDIDLEKYIVPQIKYCLETNKKIIYSRNDIDLLLEHLTESEVNKLKYNFGDNYDTVENFYSTYKIITPVVFICDAFGGLETFNLQVEIINNIKNRGYSVVGLSNKNYSHLFDIKKMPSYINSEKVSMKRKIINFNHYLKDIERELKPDLIVIEVPGELFSYSPKMLSNFGLKPFEMSYAVQNDCGILCVPLDIYDSSNYEILSDAIKNKFGINIDYMIGERKVVDSYETEIRQQMVYVHLDEDIDNNYMNLTNDKLYLNFSSDINRLIDNIVNQLKMYASIISV